MTADPPSPDPSPDDADLVDQDTAAGILGVVPEQIAVLVADQLLIPAAEDPWRFARTDLLAIRDLGG